MCDSDVAHSGLYKVWFRERCAAEDSASQHTLGSLMLWSWVGACYKCACCRRNFPLTTLTHSLTHTHTHSHSLNRTPTFTPFAVKARADRLDTLLQDTELVGFVDRLVDRAIAHGCNPLLPFVDDGRRSRVIFQWNLDTGAMAWCIKCSQYEAKSGRGGGG